GRLLHSLGYRREDRKRVAGRGKVHALAGWRSEPRTRRKAVRAALGWTGRRPILLGGGQREIDSQFPVQALGEWAVDQGHRRLIVDVAGGEVVQRVAVDPIGHRRVDGVVLESQQVVGRIRGLVGLFQRLGPLLGLIDGGGLVWRRGGIFAVRPSLDHYGNRPLLRRRLLLRGVGIVVAANKHREGVDVGRCDTRAAADRRGPPEVRVPHAGLGRGAAVHGSDLCSAGKNHATEIARNA